ncbi:MAG: hypothetical protein ACP5LN_09810 [Thermoproteota archaeon]|jgi:Fe2+ or Zn2+ uptake regulation protein
MDIDKVISALNSRLRREILRIISEEPMTVVRVLEELKRKKFEIEYRESVYRALEKLLDAGLVEKYYVKEKGLCYTTKVRLVVIDLVKDDVELRNS